MGPVSTASNADPGTDFIWLRSSSFQRVLAAPVMYHEEPLSATIIPYFFSAFRMTSDWPWNRDKSYDAFSRNRKPIGGSLGSVDDDAKCAAGRMNPPCVSGTVKPRAGSMCPAAPSPYRTRPGRIGRPAASADVQYSGRNLFDDRFQLTPTSASQWSPRQNARPSS